MDYNDLDLKKIREKYFSPATQKSFSKSLGIAERTYQNYELNGVPVGKRPMIKGTIEEHAKKLGIEISDWIGDLSREVTLSNFSDIAILKYVHDHLNRYKKIPSFKKLFDVAYWKEHVAELEKVKKEAIKEALSNNGKNAKAN